MATDFYELLGVPKNADEQTIKAAYRRLAKECHPDRKGGCKEHEAKFKTLSEAYDCLKDPQKRAAYDRFGHAAFDGGGGRAPNGFGPEFTSSMSDIFEDIFGDFVGAQRNRGQQSRLRGSDLRYNLEISLEEAFAGRTVDIDVPTLATCDTCSYTSRIGPLVPRMFEKSYRSRSSLLRWVFSSRSRSRSSSMTR